MLLLDAISAYLTHVTIERGLSGNTVSAYRRDLATYQRWCDSHGVQVVREVTSQVLSEFISWSRADDGGAFADSSVQRIVSSVRGLHRWLVTEGMSEVDPAAQLPTSTRAPALPKALTVDEVARMIDAASAEDSASLSFRNVALVEFLYATGARISEAVGIDVDDVDLVDCSAVVTGKGSKQRRVPIGAIACAALEAWLVQGRPALAALGRGSPRLFLTAHGTPMTRQAGFAVVRAAAIRAGIAQPVGPHTLRHSCATHLVEAGADVRVVQEFLGHASVQTTQIYTLVTAERLREAHAMAHPRAR